MICAIHSHTVQLNVQIAAESQKMKLTICQNNRSSQSIHLQNDPLRCYALSCLITLELEEYR